MISIAWTSTLPGVSAEARAEDEAATVWAGIYRNSCESSDTGFEGLGGQRQGQREGDCARGEGGIGRRVRRGGPLGVERSVVQGCEGV